MNARTLARVFFYPAITLALGLAIGFRAYPDVVGHKVWLLSWAYQSIFNPPEYNRDAVTWMARSRLLYIFQDVPGFRILKVFEVGEEARDFLIEYIDDSGSLKKVRKRVFVHWKLWTQNNGETRFDLNDQEYQSGFDLLKIEVKEPCEHCG